MTKIVYNACFGGFSLSAKGIQRYGQLKGLNIHFTNSTWDSKVVKELTADEADNEFMFHSYTSTDFTNENYFSDRNIARNDPLLVQVVEELGDKANGKHAALRIATIPEGVKYRIDEYDGSESVMTIDDYDWQVA